MAEHRITRSDLEALGETRRDLGPAYEPDLLEAFADRVENALQTRVGSAMAEARDARREQHALARRHGTLQFALAALSVVASIPLVLALALNDELLGLVLALSGLVVINVAHALVRPRGGGPSHPR